MTPEKLLEIMGEIDDKYIAEADPLTKNNVIRINFAALAGIAAGFAAVVVVGHALLTDFGKANNLNETQYAATAEVTEIEEAAEDDTDFAEEAADDDMDFAQKTAEDEGLNTYSADSGVAAGASTSNADAKSAKQDAQANNAPTESTNETQFAATAEIAGIEEAAKDDTDLTEKAEDKDLKTFSADSGAAMGAATSNAGASTRDAKAKNAAADNSMPESANEEENFYKDEVQSAQPSVKYNTFDFENGAILQYPFSMSERVLTATENAVKESGSDTSVYWYTALSNENAAAILSELGTKINTAEDISYIAQYFDDVNAVDYEGVKLVGYIAVNENGDIVENRLERGK